MRATNRHLTLLVAILGLCADAADAPPVAKVPHTFKYAPPAGPPPASVTLAGDFNGWSTTANPMARGADGVFAVTVDLAAGRHAYKFVVDNKWTQDPAADPALDADDGNQGKNSGVDVRPPGATPPPTTPPHPFKYVPPAGTTPATVTVAGDFNGWSTVANPLAKGPDGSFAGTVDVPPGLHHYKLLVDGKWTQDPAADPALDADDGNGGKNSGLQVGPPAAAK